MRLFDPPWPPAEVDFDSKPILNVSTSKLIQEGTLQIVIDNAWLFWKVIFKDAKITKLKKNWNVGIN